MRRSMVAAVGVSLVIALGAVVAGAGDEAKGPDGKPIFLKYKCQSCHAIEAVGIVKKAAAEDEEDGASASKKKTPDLSDVGLKKKADWIALFLQKKEKNEGKLHAKKVRGTDEELATLAAWLETMKAEKADKAAEKADKAGPAKSEAADSAKSEAAEPGGGKAGSE